MEQKHNVMRAAVTDFLTSVRGWKGGPAVDFFTANGFTGKALQTRIAGGDQFLTDLFKGSLFWVFYHRGVELRRIGGARAIDHSVEDQPAPDYFRWAVEEYSDDLNKVVGLEAAGMAAVAETKRRRTANADLEAITAHIAPDAEAPAFWFSAEGLIHKLEAFDAERQKARDRIDGLDGNLTVDDSWG
jgi:hypothetical protein